MLSFKDEDLRVIVHKALKDSGNLAKITNHYVENLSENRRGIMGNHYILVVQVQINDESLPKKLRFFVKTPPESTILRDTLVDDWVSNEEVHFFTEVYPNLMKNYKGSQWCPECYLSNSKLLVFQDLSIEGFTIRRNGIWDVNSLKTVLSTLARFHASSIIAQMDNNELALDQVYPQAFREKIFTDFGKGGRSNQLGFHTVKLLADKFGLDGAELLPDIWQKLCQLVKPVPGGLNVICHGDLWRSNIMFTDESTSLKCIIVDYQMLRYASPNVDVAVLLYVHASPECRASFELLLLQHYYDIFRRIILQANDKAQIPKYDEFLQDYNLRKLIGMACACMRWPKIVFDNVMQDPEALEKWYFENRIDIYEQAIRMDDNYAKSLRNCLLELLDEAKRIF